MFKSFERQDPGVAKFGIALEWGSRGLEFESRHSDQKIQNNFRCSGFFLFLWRDSKHLTVTVQWTVTRFRLDGNDTLVFRISTLVPQSLERFRCSGFFFFCEEIRTIKCKCPVDICLPTAGRRQLLKVPNLDTRFVFLLYRSFLYFSLILDKQNLLNYLQAANTPVRDTAKAPS